MYWLHSGFAVSKQTALNLPVNLDGENTRIVMDILRRLAHEEGRCVIVVTHDPEVADTADLVLRMKYGVLTAA